MTALPGPARVLLPIAGRATPPRAIDAALHLAAAARATLLASVLIRVPCHLALDEQAGEGAETESLLIPAIHRKASMLGVEVEARVSRGRTHRHALLAALGEHEFTCIVIAMARTRAAGLVNADVAWLLERVGSEVVLVRSCSSDDSRCPARADRLVAARPAPGGSGRASGHRVSLDRSYYDV